MRKVVDSNFLRSTDLWNYLAQSRSNQVVLTEFILMEQFKTNAPVTVRKSFEIISKFPAQIVVLKRSPQILCISTRSKGLAQRLIDKPQTTSFPAFCGALRGGTGTERVDDHIRKRAIESASHMDSLASDCRYIPEIFGRISERFTNGELMEIRSRRRFRKQTQFKLIDTFFDESKLLYRASGVPTQFWPATMTDAVNCYPFRYALCITLLYMRWLRDGQPMRATEKHVNDVIDANTAAFATYFDGTLSRDAKLLGVHTEARHIIEQMDGYVGIGRRSVGAKQSKPTL